MMAPLHPGRDVQEIDLRMTKDAAETLLVLVGQRPAAPHGPASCTGSATPLDASDVSNSCGNNECHSDNRGRCRSGRRPLQSCRSRPASSTHVPWQGPLRRSTRPPWAMSVRCWCQRTRGTPAATKCRPLRSCCGGNDTEVRRRGAFNVPAGNNRQSSARG